MDQLQRRAAGAAAAGVVQMGARDAEHFGEGFDRQVIPIVKLDALPEALDRRRPRAPTVEWLLEARQRFSSEQPRWWLIIAEAPGF